MEHRALIIFHFWTLSLISHGFASTNEWFVSVCTTAATNETVFLQLFGDLATSEKKPLTISNGCFQADHCSNFTLLLKDIGNLEMVTLETSDTLMVNKLFIRNNEISYPFHLVGDKRKSFKMVSYQSDFLHHTFDSKNAEIDLHDNFTLVAVKVTNKTLLGVQVGNKGDNNAVTWESCFEKSIIQKSKHCKQRVTGRYVNVTGSGVPVAIELDMRPKLGRTIWSLKINVAAFVNTVYVRLEDHQLSTVISYYSTMPMSTEFYTDDKLFNHISKLILFTVPYSTVCSNLTVKVIRMKSNETAIATATFIGPGCEWTFKFKTILIETTTVKTTTSLPVTTTQEPTTTSSLTIPAFNNIPTLTKGATTEKNNVITTSQDTVPEYITSAGNTVIPNTNTANSNPNDMDVNNGEALTSAATETTPSDGQANTTKWCPCYCVKKVLTEKELESRLQSLTKELKVNRNETNSYLRSKISAPDDRISSQVIGSTAVIIMVVPFVLIVLADLFPLVSLIYKKVIYFM